jgi:hypothetical protein
MRAFVRPECVGVRRARAVCWHYVCCYGIKELKMHPATRKRFFGRILSPQPNTFDIGRQLQWTVMPRQMAGARVCLVFSSLHCCLSCQPTWSIIAALPIFNRGHASLQSLEELGLALKDVDTPSGSVAAMQLQAQRTPGSWNSGGSFSVICRRPGCSRLGLLI